MKTFNFLVFILCFIGVSCSSSDKLESEKLKTIGKVVKKNEGFEQIIAPNTPIEILAEGFEWSEGPLWLESEQALIFSDVPNNIIHKWSEGAGLQEYLKPSGSTGLLENGSKEGSNGLILDHDGKLVLCQHGDRRVVRMMAALDSPMSSFSGMAASYRGQRFNSPNDICLRSNGDFFFTDPPYGLKTPEDTELGFQGVYRLAKDGHVKLLVKSLSRPNGVALSPDEKTLYVTNSDPEKALLMAYQLNEQDSVIQADTVYNFTSEVPSAKGLPDGLKVDTKGNLFTTAPGGVWVFSADGEHLGIVEVGVVPTANCALDAKETYLYMTSDNYLLRVKLMK